jgi:dTDP-4-dehydrorhamnose reductase
MKIAIVGSSGALGGHLVESFSLSGYSVVPIARRVPAHGRIADVLRTDPAELVAGVDAIVYCAWSTEDRSDAAQRAHVAAAARWAEASRAAGATFVFTSTVLAADGTRSVYGAHKLAAEKEICSRDGVALRIGLVADDALPLMVTAIRRRCRKHPALARLVDWPVFALSSSALSTAIAAEVRAPRPGGVVWLAPQETTSLATIARWPDHPGRLPGPVRRGETMVARVPLRPGRLGWLLDGWTGLVDPPSFDGSLLAPVFGLIEPLGWRERLM